MGAKFKYDDNGKIEVDENGLPVIVSEDGKEQGIDAIHLMTKVPELSEEAKNHRIKAKELEKKLEDFKDLDPSEARKALDTLNQLSSGDLRKKEELDRIKKELEEAYKDQVVKTEEKYKGTIGELTGKIDNLKSDLHRSHISSKFRDSKFFGGNDPLTHIKPKLAESFWGKNFKMEKDEATDETVMVGYINGKEIISKDKPGTRPSFDECMAQILNNDPDKDSYFNDSSGSGASGSKKYKRQVVIEKGDNEAFINNIDKVASGEIPVR